LCYGSWWIFDSFARIKSPLSNIECDVKFTRLDTNKSVCVNYTPKKIVNPMKILMSAIGENATLEDKQTFPKRFQEMVKTIFDNQDKVIEIIK